MKVTITRGGGLGGMTTRTVLASEDVPPDAARELTELAGALEPAKPAATRHPDELLYRIRVEYDDGRAIEADASDSTLTERAQRLVEWVDQRPERSDELVRRS